MKRIKMVISTKDDPANIVSPATREHERSTYVHGEHAVGYCRAIARAKIEAMERRLTTNERFLREAVY